MNQKKRKKKKLVICMFSCVLIRLLYCLTCDFVVFGVFFFFFPLSCFIFMPPIRSALCVSTM